MLHIILIKGHDRLSKGARSYNGISEYELYGRVFPVTLQHLSKYNCKVHMEERNPRFDYKPINNRIKSIRALDPNARIVTFEGHFNSFYKVALGCEMLALESDPASFESADIFTDHFSNMMNIKERHKTQKADGVKGLDTDDRGASCLGIIRGADERMLFECAFLNTENPDSVSIIGSDTSIINYGLVIARCLVNTYNLQSQEQDPSMLVNALKSKIDRLESKLEKIRLLVA